MIQSSLPESSLTNDDSCSPRFSLGFPLSPASSLAAPSAPIDLDRHSSSPLPRVMVLEATILCLDNSEHVRNSDYAPTRLQVRDARALRGARDERWDFDAERLTDE